MNTNLYLPGDEQLDMALAEYMGYFWCRILDGLVAGQRIVRFLVSPQDFEKAKADFGPSGIVLASKEEQIEQLAWKAVPAFHASRDEMAKVEDRLFQLGFSSVYRAKLREIVSPGRTGPLTDNEMWLMITASAGDRAKAAFLVIDAQRPKQQALFG